VVGEKQSEKSSCRCTRYDPFRVGSLLHVALPGTKLSYAHGLNREGLGVYSLRIACDSDLLA